MASKTRIKLINKAIIINKISFISKITVKYVKIQFNVPHVKFSKDLFIMLFSLS